MRATMTRLFAVRLIGACLAMTMLHACQQYGAESSPPKVPNADAMKAISLDRTADANAVAAASKQCTALGGKLEQAGRMGRYLCFAQYSDAGKACSDAADCQGSCRANDDAQPGQKAAGRCTPDNNPFGCYARIEHGVVSPFLCVD